MNPRTTHTLKVGTTLVCLRSELINNTSMRQFISEKISRTKEAISNVDDYTNVSPDGKLMWREETTASLDGKITWLEDRRAELNVEHITLKASIAALEDELAMINRQTELPIK